MSRVFAVLILPLVLACSALTTPVRAQNAPPVRLEPLGPSAVVEKVPRGSQNAIRKNRQFRLTNLSKKNIIVFTIAFFYRPDASQGGTTRHAEYSYPPKPPLVPAGATKIVPRTFLETPRRSEVDGEIDFVLFDDGSTFGPDRFETARTYRITVETQRLTWQAALNMLEKRGLEATKAFIREKLSHPNPILENRRRDIK